MSDRQKPNPNWQGSQEPMEVGYIFIDLPEKAEAKALAFHEKMQLMTRPSQVSQVLWAVLAPSQQPTN